MQPSEISSLQAETYAEPLPAASAARRRTADGLVVGASTLALLIVWEVITRAGLVPSVVVPEPLAVLRSLVNLFTDGSFAPNFFSTLEEYLLGFLLGSGISLVLGILMVNSRSVRTVVYPYMAAFNSVPRVALGPLFVTWFGLGIMSKVWLAAAICFFPVLVNTVLGLESADPNAFLLMRSLVATRWQVFRKLAWPSALPSIFAGLETSATLALIGAVVGEEVGARAGMMIILENYNAELHTAGTFAVLLVLSVLGLLVFSIIAAIDRRFIFWHHREGK